MAVPESKLVLRLDEDDSPRNSPLYHHGSDLLYLLPLAPANVAADNAASGAGPIVSASEVGSKDQNGALEVAPLSKKRSAPESDDEVSIDSLHEPSLSPSLSPIQPSAEPSALQQVKQVFDHLDEAFLARCLAEFDESPERTIVAILENNLPPNLQSDSES